VAKPIPSEADRLAAEELDSNGVPTKGRATPTRKEREAARKRPLVAGNSPEARKAARAAGQTQRDRARIGLANGEEKYLPVKDRGPQKRFVRDYIDARWSVGELMIPIVVLLFVATLVQSPRVQSIVELAVYALVLLIIIDCVILGFRLNRKLTEKYGADRLEKIRWYATMRAIQFRRLRLPKPQVKRGNFPV
jgi:hypothetical protein